MSVKFKINDLALRVDRDSQTIKRWEKEEFIPKARRDSRGYRIYNESEIELIMNLVHETDYFKNKKKYLRKEVTVDGEDNSSFE